MNKKLCQEYCIVIICFLLVLSVIFYPAFYQGKMIYGEDGLGSDCLDLNVPRRFLAVNSIKDYNELPFWTNSLGSGTQIIEEGETAVFYPFSLLPYYFFSIPLATNTVVFSALLIALLGMYVWLRYNGAVPLAAFCGALAWGCGGCMAFRIKHLNVIHVLAWLPVSLLLLQLFWERGKLRYCLGMTLVWTLQILAGHPQIFAVSFAADCVFAVYLIAEQYYKKAEICKRKPGSYALSVILVGAALLLALSLSALYLLPSVEMLPLTNRIYTWSLNVLDSASLQYWHLVDWLYPFKSGNPAGHWILPGGADRNIFAEATPYIGIVPLLLTFLSLFGKKRALVLYLFLSIALFIWFALGPKAGLYTVLLNYVPGFASFRSPSRFVVPIGCLAAMLTGLGAQWLYDTLSERYGVFRGCLALSCLIGLIIVDYSYYNWSFQSYLPGKWFEIPPSAAALGEHHGRVLAPFYSISWHNRMLQGCYAEREEVCYIHRNQLGPELAALWQIKSPDDYIAYNNGAVLAHSWHLQMTLMRMLYPQFWTAGQSDHPALAASCMDYYRLQNVTHIVLPHRIAGKLVDELLDSPVQVSDEQCSAATVWIYAVKNPLPKVRLVSELVKKCPDEILNIDRLCNINDTESFYEPGRFGSYDIGSAEITAETPNTLTVKTKCDRPSHLFIANTYSPNWQVFVDGSAEPLQVRRTNYAFQSVPVPAGEHKVVCKYTCPAFWRGLWVSLSGLAVFVLIVFVGYRLKLL